MPYQFKFINMRPRAFRRYPTGRLYPEIEAYQATLNLECKECVFINPRTRTRCKRRVCIGLDLCFQHLETVKHLKIKKSTIRNAGKGLFAYVKNQNNHYIVFREGDVICNYKGDVININELERRYHDKTGPYAFQWGYNKDNYYIDAANERYYSALINHSEDPNVKFEDDLSQRGLIEVIALKDIKNNEELLSNYGNEYNFNEDGVTYSTKYVR